MERWYLLISLSATVPGRYLFGFRGVVPETHINISARLLDQIMRADQRRTGEEDDPPPLFLLLPVPVAFPFPLLLLPIGCALPVRRPVCCVFGAIGRDRDSFRSLSCSSEIWVNDRVDSLSRSLVACD